MGQVFDSLPLRERERRCREMAAALIDLSLNSPDVETTAGYLDLAAEWLSRARGFAASNSSFQGNSSQGGG